MTDPVKILVKRDELTLEVSIILAVYKLPMGAKLVCNENCSFLLCFYGDRASSNFLLLWKKKNGNLRL
jgi:hypothetical protein